MDISHLSHLDRLKENAYQIAQNFNEDEAPLKYSSKEIKEAIFHTRQRYAFGDLRKTLHCMTDFLYGKNRKIHKQNKDLYSYVKAMSNLYLLKVLLKEERLYRLNYTYDLGFLDKCQLEKEGTISYLAITLEDSILSSLDEIKKYHHRPEFIAEELSEVLFAFRNYINPIIKYQFDNIPALEYEHIMQSTWRKNQAIHTIVYGGVYRNTIIHQPLEKLLEHLKACERLEVA